MCTVNIYGHIKPPENTHWNKHSKFLCHSLVVILQLFREEKNLFFFCVCVTPTGCNCWLTCVLRKWGRYFLRRADSALLTDLVSRKWTACTFSGLSLQVQTQQWVWRKALKDTEGEKQAASVVVLTGKYVSLINEVFLWGFPVHSCPDFHSDLGGEVWSA